MDMKTKSKLFFSRRNTNVTNRYELDQRRGSRNEIVNSNGRTNSQRGYTQNRTSSSEKQLHKEETLTEITLQTGPLLQKKQLHKETLTEITLQTGPLLQEKQLHKGNSNRDYTEMNCSIKRSSSTKRKLTEIILKIELLHKRAAPQGNSNRDYTEIELLQNSSTKL
jgi:hypothetical protein